MDNVVLTSASQISPNSGNTQSAVEALVATPLEPVERTDVDGNFQARMDVNYQAHDVALETAKANEHEHTNGFKLTDHHAMEIDDGYEHPDKVKSCCTVLNKLFLALAIVCFALFLASIGVIVAGVGGFNGRNDARGLSRIPYPYEISDSVTPVDTLLNISYFNLTHPDKNGIIVVLARRGASINNILIPEAGGMKTYRSIILKGTNENHFGAVRFGFDDDMNSFNMTNQLPSNYRFLNFFNEDWLMYGDINKPYRVRFVNDLVQVIYEFSSSTTAELMMTTIVSAPINEQIIVDPTNNIYFNLLGHGDLHTHHLNLSLSTPINIKTSEQIQQNQLFQGESVDQLKNVNNYFYKFNRAGIGKNFIATLKESETKTTINIFADHAGVIIDPLGVESGMHGIRISPRQSPMYQTVSVYGPTLVVNPSQAMHTTWWQFEY